MAVLLGLRKRIREAFNKATPNLPPADKLGTVLDNTRKRTNIVATVVAGGAAGNIAVPGVAAADELIAVIWMPLTGATAGAPLMVDRTAQFKITDDAIINNTGGTTTASGHLLVLYMDLTVADAPAT